jgi:hypothetical protein
MLALLLMCAMEGTPALANDAGSAVRWTRGPGAETCIDHAQLLHALGNVGAETRADPQRGWVDARIDALAGGFTVVVRAFDLGGALLDERRVNASVADCRTLDDALVVIVALMLDGVLTREPLPEDDRSMGPRLDLTLAASIASGPLPGPAAEGLLALSWTHRHLILEAAFFAGRGQRVPALEGSLDGYRLGARVTGCGQVWRSRVGSLGICGSGELGRLVIQTHGLLASNDASRMAHARLGIASRVRYYVSRSWTLWAELGGSVALGRPSVSVLGPEGPVRVYRAAALAGTLMAGVSWRLP